MSAPVALLITLSVLLGLALGVGVFTFSYADGAAYLKNDPAACANCHVMNPQYDAWLKSSHRAVATCNDCHTPHETIPKYLTKALNGWNHSVAFTTGNFHEPIRITERNERITEAACRTCHEDVVAAIARIPARTVTKDDKQAQSHRDIGQQPPATERKKVLGKGPYGR